jgi:hypothetical protein
MFVDPGTEGDKEPSGGRILPLLRRRKGKAYHGANIGDRRAPSKRRHWIQCRNLRCTKKVEKRGDYCEACLNRDPVFRQLQATALRIVRKGKRGQS